MDENPPIPNEENEKKPSVNRAERRQNLRSNQLLRDLLAVIHNFFPTLLSQLKQVEDPRYKNYTTYDISVLLMERILAAIFSIGSMRDITSEFNDDTMIQNIAEILRQDLKELPSHDTINNCFKKLKPSELESIIHEMIVRLTRRNTFNKSRIRGKYWQVLIDGTILSSFAHRHCDSCLFKRHKNKKGEVTSLEFYHYVLEAKLVLHENLVFSICTEFVENEGEIPSEEELMSPDYDEPSRQKMKQDCEIKAFYRLAAKLKKAFPKLPICITADGLYACQQVFKICEDNNWHHIIRFKEGSIPTLYDTYYEVLAESGNTFTIFRKKGGAVLPEQGISARAGDSNPEFVKLQFGYANDIQYEGFSLSMAECQVSGEEYPFLFVTDLRVDRNNCEATVMDGRRRWKIENEGFKVQKRHGYYLKHVFCKDYNAMKVHYLMIQIAHAISQLLEHGTDVINKLSLTLKEFHKSLLKCFSKIALTPEDLAVSEMPRKFRLSL